MVLRFGRLYRSGGGLLLLALISAGSPPDVHAQVTTLREALISCGAPIGSTLRFDERVIPVRDERLG